MRDYFKGKVCVVTGAASGLGLQMSKDLAAAGAIVFMADINAETLAAAGAVVFMADISPENLARARAEILGEGVHTVVTDVTDAEAVRALIEQAVSHNGRLDLLFNNAGIGATLPWAEITLEFWRKVMDINFWGVIHGLYYAVPIMRKQGGGHIVNTASVGGLLHIPYQAVYCSSKAAVAAAGESLRFELAHENIKVTTIYPGNVVTGIFAETGSIPDDAIPVADAVKIILEAVSREESMIVLPDSTRLWAKAVLSDPEIRDKIMLDMAAERRHNYETKGRYF